MGRRSKTRLALPTERSIEPGSPTLTTLPMPTCDRMRPARSRPAAARVSVVTGFGLRLDHDRQLVQTVGAAHFEIVVRGETRVLQHQLLDEGREQVDAADDQHVVVAPLDPLHPPHGARGPRQQPGEIAGPVTDDGARLLGEGGDDQLSRLAVGQHGAGLGIDDLRIEVVLPDVEAVLALDAFHGDAGADGLGAPVHVHRLHGEAGLDLLAHRLGPRLGAMHADLKRAAPRVPALTLELVGDRQHVGRRDGDDAGLEVGDHPDLTLGEAARCGDHGAAQRLRARVEAEAAGEEPVAVGDVHHVASARAGGAQAAGDEAGPCIEVGLGVAHDGGEAGGAARCMDAGDALARHGEQIEGIVEAEVLLDRERELRQVVQGPEIGRAHAGLVEALPVVGDIVVDALEGRAQPDELQRRDLVAARGLDGIELVRARGANRVVHMIPPRALSRVTPRRRSNGNSPTRGASPSRRTTTRGSDDVRPSRSPSRGAEKQRNPLETPSQRQQYMTLVALSLEPGTSDSVADRIVSKVRLVSTVRARISQV